MRLIRYTNPTWRPRVAVSPEKATAWTPPVDVIDSEKEYLLRLDLPGVEESNVEARIEGGVLRVSGERKGPETNGSTQWLRRERLSGAFERSFRLPEAVDADGVQARFERGVLEIRIPKVDRSRRIPIQ
ncbi:MAG: Hsp20 family protein [Acidobacteria bacterium]|nr:Hsp20 family protein [Acidobacteriota bacterium]